MNMQFQTVKKKQKRTICFKRYLLADNGEKKEKSQERNTTHLPSSRQNAGEGGIFYTIITVAVEMMIICTLRLLLTLVEPMLGCLAYSPVGRCRAELGL